MQPRTRLTFFLSGSKSSCGNYFILFYFLFESKDAYIEFQVIPMFLQLKKKYPSPASGERSGYNF